MRKILKIIGLTIASICLAPIFAIMGFFIVPVSLISELWTMDD